MFTKERVLNYLRDVPNAKDVSDLIVSWAQEILYYRFVVEQSGVVDNMPKGCVLAKEDTPWRKDDISPTRFYTPSEDNLKLAK